MNVKMKNKEVLETLLDLRDRAETIDGHLCHDVSELGNEEIQVLEESSLWNKGQVLYYENSHKGKTKETLYKDVSSPYLGGFTDCDYEELFDRSPQWCCWATSVENIDSLIDSLVKEIDELNDDEEDDDEEVERLKSLLKEAQELKQEGYESAVKSDSTLEGLRKVGEVVTMIEHDGHYYSLADVYYREPHHDYYDEELDEELESLYGSGVKKVAISSIGDEDIFNLFLKSDNWSYAEGFFFKNN